MPNFAAYRSGTSVLYRSLCYDVGVQRQDSKPGVSFGPALFWTTPTQNKNPSTCLAFSTPLIGWPRAILRAAAQIRHLPYRLWTQVGRVDKGAKKAPPVDNSRQGFRKQRDCNPAGIAGIGPIWRTRRRAFHARRSRGSDPDIGDCPQSSWRSPCSVQWPPSRLRCRA